MRRIAYAVPSTVPEVLLLLDKCAGSVRLLAGGTDLVPQLKNRVIRVDHIIDLKRIPALACMTSTPGIAHIGALTTLSEIIESRDLNQSVPLLVDAARTVGSVQIRNRATIGGNICRAAPSGDLLPALLVLEAQFIVVSAQGERCISSLEFFKGPGETVLADNEVLTQILIPVPPVGPGVYIKQGTRQTVDLATVGVAASVALSEGVFTEVRIALASVAPTPFRARGAEERLRGERFDEAVVGDAAALAAEEARPITDMYGSTWYKKHLISVLVSRALKKATAKAEATL